MARCCCYKSNTTGDEGCSTVAGNTCPTIAGYTLTSSSAGACADTEKAMSPQLAALFSEAVRLAGDAGEADPTKK